MTELQVMGENHFIFIVSERNHMFQFSTKQENVENCLSLIDKMNDPIYLGKIEMIEENGNPYLFIDSSIPLEEEIIYVFGWVKDSIRLSSVTKKFWPCFYSKLKPIHFEESQLESCIHFVRMNCEPKYPVEIKFDGVKGWIILPLFSTFTFIAFPISAMINSIRDKIAARKIIRTMI